MGIPVELAPHLTRLMSSEDAARYGVTTDTGITNKTGKTSRRDADERREQGDFARWLLLQNSNGADLPFEWHPLHTRSKTTPGCLDFWVGVSTGIWVEFKRDESCRLTAEQQEFRRMCEKRGIPTYVVFLAQQAINLVQRLDVNRSDSGRVRMTIEHL